MRREKGTAHAVAGGYQRLEGEAQGKFDLAFGAEEGVSHPSEVTASNIAVRLIELGSIRDVVELRSELSIQSLADSEVFKQREIQILSSRPVEWVAGSRARPIENAGGRRPTCERSGVKPFGNMIQLVKATNLVRTCDWLRP